MNKSGPIWIFLMSDRKIDAKSSLCWKCKYGMWVKDTEQERVFHAGMTGGPPDDSVSPFDICESVEDDEETMDIVEHTIEHERVRAVCFWGVKNVAPSPPITVACVQNCNCFSEKT